MERGRRPWNVQPQQQIDRPVHEMGRGFPLGRIGTPDDVARVVLFCASDMAMFMTGSVILAEAGGDAVM